MPERHSMRKSCPLLLVLAFLRFFLPGLGPGSNRADITGSVVDPTGASIVGANITAKDTERQTAYTGAELRCIGMQQGRSRRDLDRLAS